MGSLIFTFSRSGPHHFKFGPDRFKFGPDRQRRVTETKGFEFSVLTVLKLVLTKVISVLTKVFDQGVFGGVGMRNTRFEQFLGFYVYGLACNYKMQSYGNLLL